MLETEHGKDEATGVLSKIEARVEQIRSNGMLQPPAKLKNSNSEDNEDEIKFEDGEEGEEKEDEDDEDLLVTKKKLDILLNTFDVSSASVSSASSRQTLFTS